MVEKISQGEETLIPKSEWVDKKEIQGRFKLFFNKFPYKYIVFNFRHNLRNVKPALKFKNEYKQGNVLLYQLKKLMN